MKLAIVNCKHANANPSLAVRCSLKLFGGTPSPGICEQHCQQRTPRRDGPAITWVELVARKPVDWLALWRSIHQAKTVEELLAALKRVPCGKCKRHLREFVASDPIEGDLFAWTWRLHNAVNERIGKPTLTLTEAAAKWK